MASLFYNLARNCGKSYNVIYYKSMRIDNFDMYQYIQSKRIVDSEMSCVVTFKEI